MVELRLDLLQLTDEQLKDLILRARSSIVTFRPNGTDDSIRLSTLIKGIGWHAGYVDIEFEAESDYREALICEARKMDCKVLVSYHNFELTPPYSKLAEIVESAFLMGADIVKVATLAQKAEDNQTLQRLLREDQRVLAFGMGEIGTVGRIESLYKGAPFVYAAISEELATAPGQLPYRELSRQIALFNGTIPMYAVCGKPILHSQSPQIYRQMFESVGQQACYFRILSDDAAQVLSLVKELNLSGINATAPLKQELAKAVDFPQGQKTINCLSHSSGVLKACNTDSAGVISSILDAGIDPTGKSVLILGAGGAGRAALEALNEYTKDIQILNRNEGRANDLSQEYAVKYGSLKELSGHIQSCDILVNTIPASASEHYLERIPDATLIVDAIYTSDNLQSLAKRKGIKYISGYTWLINQAFPAFAFFNGTKPEADLIKLEAPRINSDLIFLTGFMGCGKSTIGKRLAELLGMDFVDTDDLIEQDCRCRIKDIFENRGEAYFRRKETEALGRVCRMKGVVVSTGGGILQAPENTSMIRGYLNIWIYRNPKYLQDEAKEARPLIQNCSYEDISALFESRKRSYAQYCSFMLLNEDITQTTKRVYDEVNHYFRSIR